MGLRAGQTAMKKVSVCKGFAFLVRWERYRSWCIHNVNQSGKFHKKLHNRVNNQTTLGTKGGLFEMWSTLVLWWALFLGRQLLQESSGPGNQIICDEAWVHSQYCHLQHVFNLSDPRFLPWQIVLLLCSLSFFSRSLVVLILSFVLSHNVSLIFPIDF